MRRRLQTQQLRILPSALLVCAGACVLFAQPPEKVSDAQILRLSLMDAKLSVDGRYKDETRDPTDGAEAGSTHQQRTEIVPSANVLMRGSLYHPNLLEFDLYAEGGLSYEDETLRTGTAPPLKRENTNPLQVYNLDVRILKAKPYNLTLFADKTEMRRDNDFFSRYTLKSDRYGGELYLGLPDWPVTFSAAHQDDRQYDTGRPRTLVEDTLDLTASNDRSPWGRTRLNATRIDFRREEEGTLTIEGTRQYVEVVDWESLPQETAKLFSELRYNDVDSSSVPSSSLSLRERLDLEHTDTLDSRLEYLFSEYDSGSTDSTLHEGTVSLRHQLYESLVSQAELEYRTSDEGSSRRDRFGGGIDEAYTKRLGPVGKLTAGASMKVYAESYETDSAAPVSVSEVLILRDGNVAVLSREVSDASAVTVSDITGIILYREGFDYRTVRSGSAVGLERVLGGDIPNGGSVRVTYPAAGQSSDDFITREDRYSVRVDLFERLLSLYARLNITDHDGGESLTLHELTETVVGAETLWYWLTAGVEYRDYDSNLLPYTSVRLFQNLHFRPTDRSSLRFEASQTETDYDDPSERIRTVSFITRFQTQLSRTLSFNADGGTWSERGREDESLDRDVVTANIDLNYRVGETTVRVGYELQDEDYLDEHRRRHLYDVRIERTF